MNEKVCLFDMDGTLAGYAQQLALEFNLIKHPSEKHYTFEDFGQHGKAEAFFENRRHYISEHGSFWEKLPPLEDGFEIFEMCKQIGFRPMVLTQGPSSKPEAWSHKIKWCQKYLPNVDVTITRDKGLVYGRVLVDDWPDYAIRWLQHRPRGLVIMPARPWNQNISHPNILRVDALNFNEAQNLRNALKEAFNRESGESIEKE